METYSFHVGVTPSLSARHDRNCDFANTFLSSLNTRPGVYEREKVYERFHFQMNSRLVFCISIANSYVFQDIVLYPLWNKNTASKAS
jgi:hypothetical protein